MVKKHRYRLVRLPEGEKGKLLDELLVLESEQRRFEFDLGHTAMLNLDFMLKGIEQDRAEDERKLGETETHDPEVRKALEISHRASGFYRDSLRIVACLLTAVALVTRFQHWIGQLIKAANLNIVRKRSNDPSLLVLQLEALNNALGDGPVPIQFFEELEEVRHSVIHANSKAEWESKPGKRRKVAVQYRNAQGETQISEPQLQEAMEKMIEQVSWYQEKVNPSASQRIAAIFDRLESISHGSNDIHVMRRAASDRSRNLVWARPFPKKAESNPRSSRG